MFVLYAWNTDKHLRLLEGLQGTLSYLTDKQALPLARPDLRENSNGSTDRGHVLTSSSWEAPAFEGQRSDTSSGTRIGCRAEHLPRTSPGRKSEGGLTSARDASSSIFRRGSLLQISGFTDTRLEPAATDH